MNGHDSTAAGGPEADRAGGGVARRLSAPLRAVGQRIAARMPSLAVKNVAMFVVMVVALVVPIAYTYLRTVENLLTDTLAAQVAVVAQRGASMIDTAALPRITRPEDRNGPDYQALRQVLGRIQDEFGVDNAVVMRRLTTGDYAYIADGNGYFAVNEHVALHDEFPETKAPADRAMETGRPSTTGLFQSQDTKWFQVNVPLLDHGDVVGLLLINKYATPVANEIRRRQWQIIGGVAAVLVLGIALWGWFAVRLSRPLDQLNRAAQQISGGNLEVEIARVDSRDEVGDLNRAFRQMVDDLRSSRQQIEAYTLLLQREKDAFFRFVPTQFLQLLGRESPVAIQLGDSSPRSMSVMFSDIRAFTTLAELLEPQSVIGFLNEYLARMEPTITAHGGFVDKFLGDGIMALFEDGPQHPSSAKQGVAAAVQMRRELVDYNQFRAERGLESIRIGVGLHTGSLVLGTVGSPDRLNTTVVGDTVNLASRLEALTAFYRAGIIVSESVMDSLDDTGDRCTREIATVRVRGKTRTVTLFDVFDWESEEARARKMEGRRAFGDALALYREGRFADAGKAFGKVHKRNPDDRTAEAYREICDRHLELPPEQWEGVDVFVEK